MYLLKIPAYNTQSCDLIHKVSNEVHHVLDLHAPKIIVISKLDNGFVLVFCLITLKPEFTCTFPSPDSSHLLPKTAIIISLLGANLNKDGIM